MPITKSAKKSLKVSETKRKQNRMLKIELEKTLKKASTSNINEVVSKIDKAAKVNLISKNKAARMKSALNKKFGSPKKLKTESSPHRQGYEGQAKVKTAVKSKKVETKTESKKEAPKKKVSKK